MLSFDAKYILARRTYLHSKFENRVLIILFPKSKKNLPEKRVLVDENATGLAAQLSWLNLRLHSIDDVGLLSSEMEDPENGWVDHPVKASEIEEFYTNYREMRSQYLSTSRDSYSRA